MPGGTSQDGVNMASKWRIDGVFWTCALKKRGQVFTRVGLLFDLYSVTRSSVSSEGPPSVKEKRRCFRPTKFNYVVQRSCIVCPIMLYLLQAYLRFDDKPTLKVLKYFGSVEMHLR